MAYKVRVLSGLIQFLTILFASKYLSEVDFKVFALIQYLVVLVGVVFATVITDSLASDGDILHRPALLLLWFSGVVFIWFALLREGYPFFIILLSSVWHSVLVFLVGVLSSKLVTSSPVKWVSVQFLLPALAFLCSLLIHVLFSVDLYKSLVVAMLLYSVYVLRSLFLILPILSSSNKETKINSIPMALHHSYGSLVSILPFVLIAPVLPAPMLASLRVAQSILSPFVNLLNVYIRVQESTFFDKVNRTSLFKASLTIFILVLFISRFVDSFPEIMLFNVNLIASAIVFFLFLPGVLLGVLMSKMYLRGFSPNKRIFPVFFVFVFLLNLTFFFYYKEFHNALFIIPFLASLPTILYFKVSLNELSK